jgi:hypothetical protein
MVYRRQDDVIYQYMPWYIYWYIPWYIHQICTKFVAFKGPLPEGSKPEYRYKDEIAFPPLHYFKVLHQLGVSCIIRLNEPYCYNRRKNILDFHHIFFLPLTEKLLYIHSNIHVCRHEFFKAGFAHYNLFFEDCASSRDATVQPLIDLCLWRRNCGFKGKIYFLENAYQGNANLKKCFVRNTIW